MPELDEDILHQLMHRSTDDLFAPSGAAAEAVRHERRRRMRHRVLAAAGTTAAAGLAVGTLAATAGPAGTKGGGAAASATPPIQTAAYVTHHIEAVLSSAGNFIIKTSATSGPGQITTTYLDPATGTTRSVVSGTGDKAVYWGTTRITPRVDYWQTTYVDYTTRTWWIKKSHSGQKGTPSASDSVTALSADSTPADISKALTAGDLRIGDHSQVNGHAAIELVYAGAYEAKASALHLWVDAKSYRPVQLDLPPFTAASTINESWIRKSSALVQQTNNPQVPAGFLQVRPSSSFN